MKARETERREETIYQLYVTDSLFYLNKNQHLTERYVDILKRNKTRNLPKKTGDEIVTDILKTHGFKFKKGGEKE